MPRFDPPHYMFEYGDTTRLREAQHALVNARGHYMGAMLGALNAVAPNTRDTIKANKQRVQAEINRVAPGLVSVNNDGTLRLNDPISAVDRSIAASFPPAVKSAIDALPLAGPNARTLKDKLKARPLTFFLDFFDPVLDAVRGALEDVMTRGIDTTTAGFKNKTTRDTGRPGIGGFVYDLSTVPLPGLLNNPKLRNINIWLVQPGDELFDANSQRLILRFRMVVAYLVLFFKKFVELQTTLARAGLDFLFGEDDTALVSVTGEETNSAETALAVDRLPVGSRSVSRAENRYRRTYTENGQRKTTYYRLSAKGLADRKAALRADYDRKYAAYVQDFKFWHPDFAARVAWVKNTEGKSESAAVAKVAGEYNLPGRFAEERYYRWLADAGEALGGPMLPRNGRRADLKGLGALGEPTATTAAVAKPATDAATPVAAPTMLDTILLFLGKITAALGALSSVLGGAALVIDAVNKPATEKEDTAQEAAARAQSQSAGGGISPLLIGGAVLAAFVILGKGRT